jgi:hypothetical protein
MMGWEELNKIKEQHLTTENSFTRLASQVFLHEPGKEFLKLLKEEYLFKSVANPNENAATAYYREGQNSLIRRIIRAIEMKDQSPSKKKSKK